MTDMLPTPQGAVSKQVACFKNLNPDIVQKVLRDLCKTVIKSNC